MDPCLLPILHFLTELLHLKSQSVFIQVRRAFARLATPCISTADISLDTLSLELGQKCMVFASLPELQFFFLCLQDAVRMP